MHSWLPGLIPAKLPLLPWTTGTVTPPFHQLHPAVTRWCQQPGKQRFQQLQVPWQSPDLYLHPTPCWPLITQNCPTVKFLTPISFFSDIYLHCQLSGTLIPPLIILWLLVLSLFLLNSPPPILYRPHGPLHRPPLHSSTLPTHLLGSHHLSNTVHGKATHPNQCSCSFPLFLHLGCWRKPHSLTEWGHQKCKISTLRCLEAFLRAQPALIPPNAFPIQGCSRSVPSHSQDMSSSLLRYDLAPIS